MNAIEIGAVETEMPTILKNGRALWLILEAAELRGLPMPFAIRADEVDHGPEVTLQFWTHDEVVAWAEVLDVDIDEARGIATGEWLEVRVEVCTTDRRAES
jgi:hypothetical protein